MPFAGSDNTQSSGLGLAFGICGFPNVPRSGVRWSLQAPRRLWRIGFYYSDKVASSLRRPKVSHPDIIVSVLGFTFSLSLDVPTAPLHQTLTANHLKILSIHSLYYEFEGL